jgi:hypothetical protein
MEELRSYGVKELSQMVKQFFNPNSKFQIFTPHQPNCET